MTFSDPRVLDLTAFDGHDDRRGRNDASDLHMIRLALDLQLDAMLLTLGAAAHAESRGSDGSEDVPWRRWLGEDLELARTLAAALVEGDAAPVPGMGAGVAETKTTCPQLCWNSSNRRGRLSRALGSRKPCSTRTSLRLRSPAHIARNCGIVTWDSSMNVRKSDGK